MRINRSLITFLPDSGAGSGTVTSVALSATMPTGLSATITGSPITTAGTIDISIAFAAGYAIPTTIKQSNWDDAYSFVTGFPVGTEGQLLRYDAFGSLETFTPNYISNPMTQMGDMIRGNAVGLPVRLPGNPTSTLMYLTSEGDGTTPFAPYWSAITASTIGAVPTSRTLTINGTTYDLTANRSWTITGGVTSVGLTSLTGPVTITGSPVTSSGNINIEIGYASASTDGLLSQSDFANFTDKMNNPFTALGQMIYSNVAGIPLVIQPNVTGTTKFLAQFGDGTNAYAPFWGSLGPEFVANAIETDYVYDIIGDIDGINTTFYTQFNYSPGTTKVYVNGLRYTLGTGYDYEELGFGTINFTTPPEAGDLIIIEYVKT